MRNKFLVEIFKIDLRDRKLFANDSYDAINDSDTPDDWLMHKLKTLQNKRYMEPDAQKRRNTERILLEVI